MPKTKDKRKKRLRPKGTKNSIQLYSSHKRWFGNNYYNYDLTVYSESRKKEIKKKLGKFYYIRSVKDGKYIHIYSRKKNKIEK